MSALFHNGRRKDGRRKKSLDSSECGGGDGDSIVGVEHPGDSIVGVEHPGDSKRSSVSMAPSMQRTSHPRSLGKAHKKASPLATSTPCVHCPSVFRTDVLELARELRFRIL